MAQLDYTRTARYELNGHKAAARFLAFSPIFAKSQKQEGGIKGGSFLNHYFKHSQISSNLEYLTSFGILNFRNSPYSFSRNSSLRSELLRKHSPHTLKNAGASVGERARENFCK